MSLSREVEAVSLVEDAGLAFNTKMCAHILIISLFVLQDIAARDGLSIHEITPQKIIEELAAGSEKLLQQYGA